MSKSKKVTAVVEPVVYKASKRGANRDPQGLSKLSLRLALARTERIKSFSVATA